MRFMWQKDADKKIALQILDVLYGIGTEIKALSQERCPVDTGVLRNSAVVKKSITKMEVTVGYGGAASAYAVRQHEDMSLYHDDGEAKFLETAFTEISPEIKLRIKQKLQTGYLVGHSTQTVLE